MTEDLKIYWKLFREKYSNEMLFQNRFNPLHNYEEATERGPVLDIGCNQSPFVLEYYRQGRKVYALDQEEELLDLLKERVDLVENPLNGQVVYLHRQFPADPLPEEQFAIIILSDILHFFTLQQCREAFQKLVPLTRPGSLIYIKAHSKDHHSNDSDSDPNERYFKHFFNRDELDQLLSTEGIFERIYSQEAESYYSLDEVEFTKEWVRRVCKQVHKIHDERRIIRAQHRQLGSSRENYIVCIYRRL